VAAQALIVTLHLLFGMTTLGLLWWLWLSLPRNRGAAREWMAAGDPRSAAPRSAVEKIAYGSRSWASSHWACNCAWRMDEQHYAAVACPDFPTAKAHVAAHRLQGRIRSLAGFGSTTKAGARQPRAGRHPFDPSHRCRRCDAALGLAAVFVVAQPAL